MNLQTLQLTTDGPGITLLEAYSALATNAGNINLAIDVPAAARLPVSVSTASFWHLQLHSVS